MPGPGDQPDLEHVLRGRLAGFPHARLRGRAEVTAIDQRACGPGRVCVRYRDLGTGDDGEVWADAVLGCDGANSTTRTLIGTTMEDLRFEQQWLVVDVHSSEPLHAYDGVQQVCDHDRAATFMMVTPGRYRWEFRLRAGEQPGDLDEAAVLNLIRPWLGGADPGTLTILRHAWYTFRGAVAGTWQDGRVFLLGDAAHRHPPTGGLGLNSAIQDAANLAWKLAAVLHGHASERLLDTYEPERKPVTTRNVQRSVENALNHIVTAQTAGISPEAGAETNWRQLRRLWSGLPEDAEHARRIRRAIASQSMEFNEHNIEYGYTYDSAAVIPDGTPEPDNPDPIRLYQPCARPGHPMPHAWLEDDTGRRLSTHDLVRPGRFLLIAGEDGQDWCRAAAKLASTWPLDAVSVGHLDGDLLDPRSTWTRHRGHGPGGAVLVRPDRVIAWRTHDTTDPLAQLSQALQQILGER